jgi:hypothetical protein
MHEFVLIGALRRIRVTIASGYRGYYFDFFVGNIDVKIFIRI